MHILTPRQELILPVNFGMAGWWKLVATNVRTGRQRVLADWFPNLITDWGLNQKGLAANRLNLYCHVGSGSAVPAVTDSSLETWVASTSTLQSESTGAQSSAPYFGWKRTTYRFAEGAAAGNLSEIGVSPLGGSTDNLFSRALILDGSGNPTTITVLADEVLDATYELRKYPPTTDGSLTVTDGATTYTITARAAVVTNATRWGSGVEDAALVGGTGPAIAYDGLIGSITQLPSGNNKSGDVTNVGYSNNSLEKGWTGFWGLNTGNFATGIKSIATGDIFGRTGRYQFQFDPVIDKDNTKELTVGFKVGWGRASI